MQSKLELRMVGMAMTLVGVVVLDIGTLTNEKLFLGGTLVLAGLSGVFRAVTHGRGESSEDN